MNDRSIVFCGGENPIHFIIEHDQNYQLGCDPDPATPAGIRYLLLYSSGMEAHIRDLNTLLKLPLHRINGEVAVLGSGVAEDLIITEDHLSILALERPFEVWIVPFISHNINSTTFEGHFESDDQCLDFNLQTAISFTALNKIQMLFRPSNLDDEGNIEIQYNEIWGTGGLPELYPMKKYHVNIVDSESGDTMSIIHTGDGKERFKPITKTGEFFIWLNDSLGCESGGLSGVKFSQPTIHLYGRDDYAHQGDIRCMPVLVDNFFDLDEFSIRIDWNSSDLRMNEINNIHPLLTSGLIDIDSSKVEEGNLTFTWSDKSNNFKLVPGTKLFDICYRVLASPGTRTEISFHRPDTYFDTGYFLSEWSDSSGTITVGPENWNVVREYTYCYTGRDTVKVTFHTLGRFPPFTMEIPEVGISKSGIKTNDIIFENLPAGEYSYRLTDSLGNTHFVDKAIYIPTGSQQEIFLQEAIPPECGEQDGMIKLETIEYDYQYIHMAGPGKDNTYSQKNLFEDLTVGNYTFTSYDVNDCPSVPLTVNLSGGSELKISVDIQDQACDDTLATIVLDVFNESMEEVNTEILFDHDKSIVSGTPVETVPGTYLVEINNPGYCELMMEITIPEVSEVNSVKLSVMNVEVTQGEPFVVAANYVEHNNIASYQWFPALQLQRGETDEATFILDSSSWIRITATDERGCTYSDSIFIKIPEEVQPDKKYPLFLPNAITPNGDGYNDKLRYYSQNPDLMVENVYIYDRYGNILYRSKGPFVDRILWDGKVNDNPIPPGVYVVQLNIRNNDFSMVQVMETLTVLK